MDALLIGSRAMRFWYPDSRTPKDDYDLLATASGYEKLKNLNYISSKSLKAGDDLIELKLKIGTSIGIDNDKYESVKMLIDANKDSPSIDLFGLNCRIATAPTLMAIKKSHLYYRHNWYKHIEDYHYLKGKDTKLDSTLLKALELRQKERSIRETTQRTVNLNASNDEFFRKSDKAVRRKFVHDDLHLAIAFYDRPIFESIKTNPTKALVDESLFNNLDHLDKCRLVVEEACVIGLERIIIPQWYNSHLLSLAGINTNESYKSLDAHAYKYAIMRICTDLTKGWFREFAVENYNIILKMRPDYVGLWLKAFKDGKIKLCEI